MDQTNPKFRHVLDGGSHMKALMAVQIVQLPAVLFGTCAARCGVRQHIDGLLC